MIFLNEFSGIDLDEIIDIQKVTSRYLWYFQTEFMGADLDEWSIFKSRDLWYFQTEFIRASYVWLHTFAYGAISTKIVILNKGN